MGYVFLGSYVLMIGTATFLQKYGMKELTPYQINFLMALGMVAAATPALWLKEGSLSVPTSSLHLGAPIGILMALGSISFVLAISKLPVGAATAISTSYVLLVVLLSRIFLQEELTWTKIAGILLTVAGVALLSWQERS